MELEDLQRLRLECGWSARAALAKEIVSPSNRVLDVGCSFGEYTLPIATIARSVDALDPSLSALRSLEKVAADRGLTNVRTTSEAVEAWAGKHPAAYDLIWCTSTLQILTPSTRRSMFNAFSSLLAPGGQILCDFTTPTFLFHRGLLLRVGLRNRITSLVYGLDLRRRRLTVRRFRSLASNAGFVVTEEVQSPIYDFCRSIEGNTFNTVFGRYYRVFRLAADCRSSPSPSR